MSTLLNIAGKIDEKTVTLFEVVGRATADLDMPHVVVGATARDIVLHYGHGANVERATTDVDFAIEVPSWAAFYALRKLLCEQGFKATKREHRLISPCNTMVDIVPFGLIEDERADIAWPPEGDVIMSVLGFQEAFDNAEWVRMRDEPELDVPIATPVGMVLLKIIAWTDRDKNLRTKDATDIAYLLHSYEKIPEVTDALYDENNVQLMEAYDWDITQASACLLGMRASNIAKENTLQRIRALINEELGNLNLDLLVVEMCTHVEAEFDRKLQLLSAFMDGFNYEKE